MSVWCLGVTTAGPILWVLLVAAISASVGVATGLLASAFARTEFQAVQFMPLVIGPQIYLCGLLVPHSSMPRALQVFADALPMTYAVRALQAIAREPSLIGDVLRNAVILGIFALVALLLGALSMPRRTR